jgi:hypothetical protein
MSSYTNSLGLELPTTGSRSGTWGDMTNTNMEIIDRGVGGVVTITLSGTTHTLTTTDGSKTDGQYKVLALGGSPSGENTITISPNNQTKLYVVVNSSGQTAVFSQGSGANVSIPNGGSDIIYADGAGSGAAVTSVFSKALATGNVTSSGTISAATAFVPDAADGATLGTAALEFSDLFLADAGVINFGNDQDVTLTHVADSGLTLSAGANATQLSISSTESGASVGPTINLVRDSGSPADNDALGYLNFVGDNSAAAQESYAQIYAMATDVTNGTEDGVLYINTMNDGTVETAVLVMDESVAFKVNDTLTYNQGFAQNTAMVFYQETAPTGWTKVTSGIDDKALRVQTGSAGGTTGGSVAFETAFASQSVTGSVSTSVGSTTLALSQIPSHSHSVRGSVASSGSAVFGAGNTAGTNTANAGGGGSHTHSGSSSFSGSAINLDVAYLNVIVCTKDA